MLQAFVVTTVQEPGGDESFTTETIPYSPYSSYVGVRKPEGEILETDKDHKFNLAVLDASGKRVSGHKVEYAVFKTGWSWWWDNAGGSLDAYVNGSSVKKIISGEMTSGLQDAVFSFRVDYPEWGRYLVLARDKTSGHISGTTFTVDWPEFRGRADRRDPEALTMLTFSTSKPSRPPSTSPPLKADRRWSALKTPEESSRASGCRLRPKILPGASLLPRKWLRIYMRK